MLGLTLTKYQITQEKIMKVFTIRFIGITGIILALDLVHMVESQLKQVDLQPKTTTTRLNGKKTHRIMLGNPLEHLLTEKIRLMRW